VVVFLDWGLEATYTGRHEQGGDQNTREILKESHRTYVSVGDVSVEVVRKRVKNFNLKIYPPDGRVRLSAPLRVSAEEVRNVLTDKMDWILRKRDDIRSRPRSSVARMVD
jgi:predicted metal-dependent hydrolase